MVGKDAHDGEGLVVGVDVLPEFVGTATVGDVLVLLKSVSLSLDRWCLYDGN